VTYGRGRVGEAIAKTEVEEAGIGAATESGATE
jgi:hypothetical protein